MRSLVRVWLGIFLVAMPYAATPQSIGSLGAGATAASTIDSTPGQQVTGTAPGVTKNWPSIPGIPSIASTTQLIAASTWVYNTLSYSINQGLAEVKAGNQQDTVALTKEIDGLSQSFNTELQNRTLAERTFQYEDTYGQNAAALSSCSAPGIGATALAASAATPTVMSALQNSQHAYNTHFAYPEQVTTYLATQLKPQDTSPSSLFPTHGSINPTTEDSTSQYVSLLTNPKPIPVPPTSAAGNPAAARGIADGRVYSANIGLASNALNYIASLHTANVSVSPWMQDAWSSMGGTGNIPGEINNEISPQAMLSLVVQSRFANAEWYNHLSGENQTALLREIALMNSANLQVGFDRMQLEERLLAILAAQYANHVRTSMKPALVRDYQAYMSNQ